MRFARRSGGRRVWVTVGVTLVMTECRRSSRIVIATVTGGPAPRRPGDGRGDGDRRVTGASSRSPDAPRIVVPTASRCSERHAARIVW